MAVARISKEELKQRLESGDSSAVPIVVDARLKYPFEHSTLKIPGAIRMSPKHIDTAALAKGREVIAYDSDPDELASSHLATALIRQGFTVRVLKGGITEWIAANFPVESKEAPRQAPPQPGALKD